MIEKIAQVYWEKVNVDWSKMAFPEYVATAIKAIFEEEKRCDEYYPNSKQIVVAKIVHIFIKRSLQDPMI